MRTIGVTGTNGKTTTAWWIHHACGESAGHDVRDATFLRRPGQPLDVWPRRWLVSTVGSFVGAQALGVLSGRSQFDAHAKIAAEAGAVAATIEMTSAALSAGFAQHWPAEIGVFTNLSHDHLRQHGSPEAYLAAKAQLFLALRGDAPTAVLPVDDPAARLIAELLPATTTVSWFGASWKREQEGPSAAAPSTSNLAWLDRGSVDIFESRASMVLARHGEISRFELRVPLAGLHFLENAAAAVQAAVATGVEPHLAVERIASAPLPRGRFEVLGDGPRVVIDDAHTPDALVRTLDTARALTRGRLLVVTGAGGQRDPSKRPAMGQAASLADVVILTSDNARTEDPREIAAQMAGGVVRSARLEVELDRRRAIELAVQLASGDDLIVVAGRGAEVMQETQDGPQELDDYVQSLRALQDRGR